MENIANSPAAASTSFDAESQRLRAMAGRLIDAYHAAPTPRDHAGIGRAARALISLNRLIKALYEGKATVRKPAAKIQAVARPQPEPETPEDQAAEPAQTREPMVLNRHARRRIAANLLREEKLKRTG